MREGEDLSGNKARQAAAAAAAKAAVTADAAASVIVLVIRTGRHPCARARGCGHACMIPLLPGLRRRRRHREIHSPRLLGNAKEEKALSQSGAGYTVEIRPLSHFLSLATTGFVSL